MQIIKLVLIILLLQCVYSIAESAAECSVTDAEAISIAKNFCKKVSISFSREPSVRRIKESSIDGKAIAKQIEFGERGDSKGAIDVSCSNNEVLYYQNWELRNNVRKKYRIPSVTTEPHNWPPFLSEEKSKKIMTSIANKVGLPSDAEFSSLDIDRVNGQMSGKWVKKYKGFPYEGDGIRIGIMAVDGEFVSYSKSYYGKPCPTEVNVSKPEAIKEGWKQIERLFSGQADWNRHEDDYEIKSAELKIVQPNVLAGRIVSRRSPQSRLAWVIEYKLKDKLKQADSLLLIKIKIDAGTKKFLGGDHSR